MGSEVVAEPRCVFMMPRRTVVSRRDPRTEFEQHIPAGGLVLRLGLPALHACRLPRAIQGIPPAVVGHRDSLEWEICVVLPPDVLRVVPHREQHRVRRRRPNRVELGPEVTAVARSAGGGGEVDVGFVRWLYRQPRQRHLELGRVVHVLVLAEVVADIARLARFGQVYRCQKRDCPRPEERGAVPRAHLGGEGRRQRRTRTIDDASSRAQVTTSGSVGCVPGLGGKPNVVKNRRITGKSAAWVVFLFQGW
jgi:hypothetical protein